MMGMYQCGVVESGWVCQWELKSLSAFCLMEFMPPSCSAVFLKKFLMQSLVFLPICRCLEMALYQKRQAQARKASQSSPSFSQRYSSHIRQQEYRQKMWMQHGTTSISPTRPTISFICNPRCKCLLGVSCSMYFFTLSASLCRSSLRTLSISPRKASWLMLRVSLRMPVSQVRWQSRQSCDSVYSVSPEICMLCQNTRILVWGTRRQAYMLLAKLMAFYKVTWKRMQMLRYFYLSCSIHPRLSYIQSTKSNIVHNFTCEQPKEKVKIGEQSTKQKGWAKSNGLYKCVCYWVGYYWGCTVEGGFEVRLKQFNNNKKVNRKIEMPSFTIPFLPHSSNGCLLMRLFASLGCLFSSPSNSPEESLKHPQPSLPQQDSLEQRCKVSEWAEIRRSTASTNCSTTLSQIMGVSVGDGEEGEVVHSLELLDQLQSLPHDIETVQSYVLSAFGHEYSSTEYSTQSECQSFFAEE